MGAHYLRFVQERLGPFHTDLRISRFDLAVSTGVADAVAMGTLILESSRALRF